ncbi:hypothetical protein [Nocardia higoensis]|uniref:hypothetical protein n=1 Tax=Nocardia higoensis TaxID=228599 RepID=UPI00031707E6|nr:hypothetical protein [Nocardia higoensis]
MLVRIRPEAELSAAEREFVDCLRAVPTTCLTLVDVRVDRGGRRVDAVLFTPRGMTVAEVRGFQRRQSGILSARADGPWKISGEPVVLDDESSPSEQLEHGIYAVRATLERALLDPGHVCGFVALLPYRGVVVRPARTTLRPGLDVVVANVTDTAEFRSYIEKFGDEPAVWDIDRVLGAVDALDMGDGLSRADLRDDGFVDRNPGGPEPRRRTSASPRPAPGPSAPASVGESSPPAAVSSDPSDREQSASAVPAAPEFAAPGSGEEPFAAVPVSASEPERTPSGAIPMPAPPHAAAGSSGASPGESGWDRAEAVPIPTQSGAGSGSAVAPDPATPTDRTPPPYVPPATSFAPPPPSPGDTHSPMAPPPPSPGDTPPPAAPPPPGVTSSPAAPPMPDAPPSSPGYAPPEWEPSPTDPPEPTAHPTRLKPLPQEEMVAPQAQPDAPPSSPPPGYAQSGWDPTPADPADPTAGPARLKPLPRDEMAPPPFAPPPPAPAPKPRSRLRGAPAWIVLVIAGLGLIAVVAMIVTAQTTDDGVSEPVPSSTRVSGTVTVEPTTVPPGPNACFPFQTDC